MAATTVDPAAATADLVGLGCFLVGFSDGFGLILVFLDFELGFMMFWFDFLLILWWVINY